MANSTNTCVAQPVPNAQAPVTRSAIADCFAEHRAEWAVGAGQRVDLLTEGRQVGFGGAVNCPE